MKTLEVLAIIISYLILVAVILRINGIIPFNTFIMFFPFLLFYCVIRIVIRGLVKSSKN
jgi:hypothetical protein